MSHVMTAKEIARWACSGGAHEPSIEQAILRHMEHHMQKAAKAERGTCQELAARYGGNDAEAIAELIGQRNFKR